MGKFTLTDSLALQERMFRRDNAMSWEEYDEMLVRRAESEAENAWLRHAENAGWQEIAYLEQYAPWAI